MPYSKNPEAYPEAMRNLLQAFAHSPKQLRKTLPPQPTKQAIRYRAQFYALRKILTERLMHEGNSSLAEKYLAVSITSEKAPGDMLELTISNHYGLYGEGFINALDKILEELKTEEPNAPDAPKPAPVSGTFLTPEQQKELVEATSKAQEESLQEQAYIQQHLGRYKPAGNPFFQETDLPADEEPSDEDREAWERSQSFIQSDNLDTRHERFATNAERKAAKDARLAKKEGNNGSENGEKKS